MNSQTEEIELAQGKYCKAGFWHGLTDKCDHIVSLPMVGLASKTGGFALPDDYYSDEAVARRREENRAKYKPIRRSYHQERELVGNEALGLTDWKK